MARSAITKVRQQDRIRRDIRAKSGHGKVRFALPEPARSSASQAAPLALAAPSTTEAALEVTQVSQKQQCHVL